MGSYQQRYQELKNKYDMVQTIDIDEKLSDLDTAVSNYMRNESGTNQRAIQNKFDPISTYYEGLTEVNEGLRKLLKDSGQSVADADMVSASQERYNERQHPDQAVKARELMGGLFQTLRPGTIPILLSVGVFMVAMSFFLLLQYLGVTASIGVPPAIAGLFVQTQGALPFWRSPMFLTFAVVGLLITTLVFAGLYYSISITKKKAGQ